MQGIHHVTAIAGDPQRNLDFYAGLLGLRLVKRTVNFDDPQTYHLYYGDELGRPGTILTFFPWPRARRGQLGAGQVSRTDLAIPESAIGFWHDRLRRAGIAIEASRADGGRIDVRDPDGLRLGLVAEPGAEARAPWASGPVPEEVGVRGVLGVALRVADPEATARVLTGPLGFESAGNDGLIFLAGVGGAASRIELEVRPSEGPGRVAAGSVHHVAWRATDDAAQAAARRSIQRAGLVPTETLDRQYFRSIYFREPGGVLFEIATDGPGFDVDESADSLGENLRLPAWLETHRERIEQGLPELDLDGARRRAVLEGRA